MLFFKAKKYNFSNSAKTSGSFINDLVLQCKSFSIELFLHICKDCTTGCWMILRKCFVLTNLQTN